MTAFRRDSLWNIKISMSKHTNEKKMTCKLVFLIPLCAERVGSAMPDYLDIYTGLVNDEN